LPPASWSLKKKKKEKEKRMGTATGSKELVQVFNVPISHSIRNRYPLWKRRFPLLVSLGYMGLQ
jgi:hypothetical protein